MKKRYPLCFHLLIGLGLIFIVFGVVLWFVLPIIVKSKVKEFLPLEHKTVVYTQWKNTTMPIYMEFWFFNIVNPLEVENGEKPYVVQVGPYTYREYRIKENITFINNGTVSYRQKRLFFFDRSRSVGNESDIITTLNIPMIVLGDKIRSLGFLDTIISLIVKAVGDKDVIMKVSVGNLTWGYEDPTLKMVNDIISIFGYKIDPIVGLFYKKNDTDDGEYLVDSGSNSLNEFLTVRKWRHSSNLMFWNSNISNMINGTDGTMFRPFLNELPAHTPLYVFQSDICRSIYAEYSSATTVNGIPAATYTPPYAVFANSSENPANHGFCVAGVCLGSGVLNLTTCIPGMPVVMSQPHLYQAADKYQAAIEGLRPSRDCVTTLTVEPTTGLPLDLQKKLQINIAVRPVPQFLHMDRLRPMLVPVMWLNESVHIDDGNAAMLRAMLVGPVRAATGVSIGGMALGLVVVVAVLVCVLLRSVRARRDAIINDHDA